MRRTLILAVALLTPAAFAPAATITAYDFTGLPGDEASVSPANQPPGATLSVLTRSPTLTPNNEMGMDSINSHGWVNGLARDYYQFTITPTAGSPQSLLSLGFTDRRSPDGPTSFAVVFSLDNFATSTTAGTFTLADTANHQESVGLASFTSLQNFTSAVTFRIEGASSTSTRGTYRLGRDLSEAGSNFPATLTLTTAGPAAVPEPASVVLLGCGLAGLLAARIRRRA